MRGLILVALAATAVAGSAQAGERTGYAAIVAGDLSQAERMLTTERRIFPQRPELMLNLAAVYQQTGRTGAAASLYRDVLAQPAVAMDLPNGSTRSSHAIADAALRRFAPTTLANR
ncbi:tetratricopeptide repeat protein [Sphingomonas rubra]|uniref:Tetratricopeptide repeat-containing protein n=1 Tax=Sphingomonas rubra TaxID=634430 RepID=A0A1I5U0P6_9SPHN|nr:hypothetical protein [Sphingomonas rubra]SFP88853.1 hypothetical protein SAMN04488241_1101 [Sphingomonas rubra]